MTITGLGIGLDSGSYVLTPPHNNPPLLTTHPQFKLACADPSWAVTGFGRGTNALSPSPGKGGGASPDWWPHNPDSPDVDIVRIPVHPGPLGPEQGGGWPWGQRTREHHLPLSPAHCRSIWVLLWVWRVGGGSRDCCPDHRGPRPAPTAYNTCLLEFMTGHMWLL